MNATERLVDNLILVSWLPALFWILGGILCLALRRSRWGAPVWTLVATPAIAFLFLIGWIVFRSRGANVQPVNGPAPGLVLFVLTLPLTLLSVLVVATFPPPRSWRMPTALLCGPALLAAIAMSAGLIYARRDAHISTPTVKLIVPDGFSGPIWIREHPDHGVPPFVVDGVTHYVIPDTGRLTTAEIGPLWGAKRFAAAYANGQEIADTYGNNREGIRLWHLGTTDGVHRFLVGTQKQRHALKDAYRVPTDWPDQDGN